MKPKMIDMGNGLKVSETIPHIVHGCPKNLRPTHTHGLASVGLPEMFINAKAYGVIDNTNLINAIYSYLCTYESEWEFVVDGVEIEIKMWDIRACIKPRDESFSGVKITYEDQPSETGYAQIYIKGDDHVLTDEYFIKEAELAAYCNDCEE